MKSSHGDPADLIVVLGPTASGKTRLAVQIASALGGEIVSADSRQVYRELDIGAGKDRNDYHIDGREIPVHLLDICGLDEEYNVYRYQQDCFAVIEQLQSREVIPVLAGGTGLYIESVICGYRMVDGPRDPRLRAELAELSEEELAAKLLAARPRVHNTTDTEDRERMIRALEIEAYKAANPPPPAPNFHPLILGTRWPREELRNRIRERLKARMNAGLIEEVQGLIEKGVSAERLKLLGLEYRYVAEFLEGDIRNRNDLFQKLAGAIVQFAKRQETWFRRMERHGCQIHWVDKAEPAAAYHILQQAGFKVD